MPKTCRNPLRVDSQQPGRQPRQPGAADQHCHPAQDRAFFTPTSSVLDSVYLGTSVPEVRVQFTYKDRHWRLESGATWACLRCGRLQARAVTQADAAAAVANAASVRQYGPFASKLCSIRRRRLQPASCPLSSDFRGLRLPNGVADSHLIAQYRS